MKYTIPDGGEDDLGIRPKIKYLGWARINWIEKSWVLWNKVGLHLYQLPAPPKIGTESNGFYKHVDFWRMSVGYKGWLQPKWMRRKR